MPTVILGDWNDTTPAAPAGYDLAHLAVDRSVSPPKFSVAVPRATADKYGTIILDASGSATKYLGADGNWHDVPAGGPGGASDFLGLSDTPDSYAAQGGKIVAVNAGATGLEFIDAQTSTSPADIPPAVPNAMDDEFSGAALDGKWTWINQGTATATLANGLLSLTALGVAGDQLRILAQPLPAGAWEFTTKIHGKPNILANYYACGLGIRDSATGRIHTCELINTPEIRIGRWNNQAAFGSYDLLKATLEGFWSYVYLRIKYDNANLIFSISKDGVAWGNIFRTTLTAWTAAPNQIVLFADCNNATNALITEIQWFRRTA